MSEVYLNNLAKVKQDIEAQKTIYKFKTFFYSLNRDVRQYCFTIYSKNYLDNEFNNNAQSITERGRLQDLINHWSWRQLENDSTQWWFQLATTHSHSATLMTLIHLWIDDMGTFDPEAFETSTIGVR